MRQHAISVSTSGKAAVTTAAYRSSTHLEALERVVYGRPFVLIAADNDGVGTVDHLETVKAAVSEGMAPTAGGRLTDCMLGADIDAEDPLIGDAVAEALISWCERHSLPYLLRESGRPGGRHLIAVVTSKAVPVQEWAQLCRELSQQFGVVVDNRTGKVLRLLTAPHRRGLPTKVIACSITVRIVQDATRLFGGPDATAPKSRKSSKRKYRKRSRTESSVDRSAREYGIACECARRGHSGRQAWKELNALGGHAAEKGEKWFRKYVWLHAVTTTAAEGDHSEQEAWQLAQRACPSRCATRGRQWWRGLWELAVADAATDRPRRRRLPGEESSAPAADLDPETEAEIEAIRRGLHEAVETELADLDPRRRNSAAAVCYVWAVALVTREGSMSIRKMAECAQLDPNTVHSALRTVVARGLVVRTREYTGGASNCAAYSLGPAAEPYVSAAQNTFSDTRGSTPAPHGRANLRRLRITFSKARKVWTLRCDVLATLAPGERLADSQHPSAKMLRSLWYQRKWWRELTPDQKEARRAERRKVLGGMTSSDRGAWFDWLNDRSDIVDAVDRIMMFTATTDDVHTVLTAPLTIHRGLADPQWRTGGTQVTMMTEQQLCLV